MAVAVFKSPISGECHGNNKVEDHPRAGSRRVYVQTETGCVFGMELDRGSNAHTVKRKLQIALNVPPEESSLTFGDMILKNDLSAVRNDCALLLTRNMMHRSLSNPCLSLTEKEIQQKDWSRPIELLSHSGCSGRAKELVNDIVKAMKMGVEPVPVHSGLGGAYYFKNCKGENVAIVKPTDEEPFAPNNPKGFVGKALGQPGLKCSVRIGETGFREVAAYLLDYDDFASVPPTALAKVTHTIFNVNDGVNGEKVRKKQQVSKIASIQQFISHDFDASDYGTSSFPVSAVHRIGILDIRIFNTDRHAGNLLVRKLDGVGSFGQVELIPIDHGLCLPENLEDPYFEWIHWPQASIPFSDGELKYIENLDPLHDSGMLQKELPMIREACLRVLVVCTIFLKEAAAFGLCLAEIGEMMSREFRTGDEEPSELEFVCIEARNLLAKKGLSSPKNNGQVEDFQFDIDFEKELHLSPIMAEGQKDFQFDMDPFDCEEPYPSSKIAAASDFMVRAPFHVGFGSGNGRNLLSKVDETVEDSEGEEQQFELSGPPAPEKMQMVSKLSASLKDTSLGENCRRQALKPGNGYLGNSSSGDCSGKNKKLPTSTTFVTLEDMSKDEWFLFLGNFQELLYTAFAKRKSVTPGQRQRLGTSCRF